MDDATKAALASLAQAVADQSAAIVLLNSNMQAMYQNVKRLSERLAIHEATEALEEMDQPRVVN